MNTPTSVKLWRSLKNSGPSEEFQCDIRDSLVTPCIYLFSGHTMCKHSKILRHRGQRLFRISDSWGWSELWTDASIPTWVWYRWEVRSKAVHQGWYVSICDLPMSYNTIFKAFGETTIVLKGELIRKYFWNQKWIGLNLEGSKIIKSYTQSGKESKSQRLFLGVIVWMKMEQE